MENAAGAAHASRGLLLTTTHTQRYACPHSCACMLQPHLPQCMSSERRELSISAVQLLTRMGDGARGPPGWPLYALALAVSRGAGWKRAM
jgi:hypothetical protein